MDTGYWWESDTVRDQYEEQDVGGGIIFKWILDSVKWNGLDLSGSG
jgi:hypothetical protein